MTLTELKNQTWYVFTAIADFVSYGKSLSERRLVTGTKGYIRRNDHDQTYYEIVAKTEAGGIGAWYLSTPAAEKVCDVEFEAPAFVKPLASWRAFWRAYGL